MQHVAQLFLSITMTLMSVLGVSIHALAMSAPSMHSMSGMSHGSSSSLTCANLCASAAIQSRKQYDEDSDEQDDKTFDTPDYMTQWHALETLAIAHGEQAKMLVSSEPPPGSVSFNALYSVFRF